MANTERKQCVERFFRDLENSAYEIRPKGPEFCIGINEKTLCHQQGEALDGTPMRGTPFILQPWHIFILYNLLGFFRTGTNIVRFHEALIFIPRKNTKTTFAASIAWALSLWYRKSGAKCYISTAAMLQSLETFNFLKYNIRRMGEDDKDGGHIHIIDNNNEHSFEANLPDGSFSMRALAANPDTQDSLNCNLAVCDEIHAFKTTKSYNLFKEAMKAYTNKLMIGISTAGDNANGFLGQRLKYCRSILDAIRTAPESKAGNAWRHSGAKLANALAAELGATCRDYAEVKARELTFYIGFQMADTKMDELTRKCERLRLENTLLKDAEKEKNELLEHIEEMNDRNRKDRERANVERQQLLRKIRELEDTNAELVRAVPEEVQADDIDSRLHHAFTVLHMSDREAADFAGTNKTRATRYRKDNGIEPRGGKA